MLQTGNNYGECFLECIVTDFLPVAWWLPPRFIEADWGSALIAKRHSPSILFDEAVRMSQMQYDTFSFDSTSLRNHFFLKARAIRSYWACTGIYNVCAIGSPPKTTCSG
jgi:hypothetical protein